MHQVNPVTELIAGLGVFQNSCRQQALRQQQIISTFMNIARLSHKHGEDIKTVFLAVNPVLFCNFNWSGECTFAYFLKNKSIDDVIEALLRKLFVYYSFDDQYIASLMSINNAFESDTGDIIQIFVPKR